MTAVTTLVHNLTLRSNHSQLLSGVPHPILLHTIGTLSSKKAVQLQQLIANKDALCRAGNVTPLFSTDGQANCTQLKLEKPWLHQNASVSGLPPDRSFAVGQTHVFVIDNGPCHGRHFSQVFIFNDRTRVRVRVNDLVNGLSVAFFQPQWPGSYTMHVLQHHMQSVKHKRRTLPVVAERLLLEAAIEVVQPPSEGKHQRPPTCRKGPHAGGWVKEAGTHSPCTNTTYPGSDWIYRPYTCHFPQLSAREAFGCLDGKWILFHGDSTSEEDAIGLIKVVLGGWAPDMVKLKHSDKWANFDVLVLANGTVRFLPEGVLAWKPPRGSEEQGVVRVTMRYNGQTSTGDKRCKGLQNYRCDCAFVRELIRMSHNNDTTPDVLIFNSLLWDVMHGHIEPFRELLRDVFDLLQALHVVSPRTLMLFRTANAAAGKWRLMPDNGAHRLEAFLTSAVSTALQHSFLRVVDIYDLAQTWSNTLWSGDGHHFSTVEPDPDRGFFVHEWILRVLVNEMCV